VGNRTKLESEFLVRGGNRFPVRTHQRALSCCP
jgi:hypothetical protein